MKASTILYAAASASAMVSAAPINQPQTHTQLSNRCCWVKVKCSLKDAWTFHNHFDTCMTKHSCPIEPEEPQAENIFDRPPLIPTKWVRGKKECDAGGECIDGLDVYYDESGNPRTREEIRVRKEAWQDKWNQIHNREMREHEEEVRKERLALAEGKSGPGEEDLGGDEEEVEVGPGEEDLGVDGEKK